MDLESIPVDLCDVAEDVCGLFWDRAMLKGIDLSAYVDPATPRLIFGDPTRLRQVIGALVNNAIESTETGGVLVEVEPDSGGSVRISVRDTGAGMTRDEIAGVFGAFTQADQSSTRTLGGAGLGLAISEKLVDSMCGRLRVTSEVGRGSTFAFRLPTTVAEGASPWPTTKAGKASAVVAHTGVSTRRALGRYLARAGYTVEADAAVPALALGTAEGLQALDRPGATAIRLGEYDDSPPAQAVLVQPFRRRDLESLLGQLACGEPLRDGLFQNFVPIHVIEQMRRSAAEPLRKVG